MNLAIFSPNFDAYSQTFIKAHKNLLNGNKFYYYGGLIPTLLELNGEEVKLSETDDEDEVKFRNLAESLKSNGINIVLAEFGQTGATNFQFLKEQNIKLVVHFHGYDAHQNSETEKYGELYKEMFQYASFSIGVSRFMERQLYKLGCPQEKLIYSTYGPNEIFLANEPQFNKKQFISIGRFVDKKAPYFTIMAFQKLLQKHPDATLLLGGQGILKNTCWNMVQHFGINKSVRFLGVLTHESVAYHFSQSIAYVQHSMQAFSGDCEGTPVVIIEASGAAIPVISTKHAGIPDVIENGYSGILVDEGDVNGMAEGMITIASDFNLAQKMGKAGRKIILDNYTMERHIEKLNDVLLNATL